MKRFLLLTALMISVLLPSCKKDSADNDNSNSQEELHAWFIDNGWHEAIVQYGNTCEGVGGFYLNMDVSGNVIGLDDYYAAWMGRTETQCDYRLYSSLETVKELTEAQQMAIQMFLCVKTQN